MQIDTFRKVRGRWRLLRSRVIEDRDQLGNLRDPVDVALDEPKGLPKGLALRWRVLVDQSAFDVGYVAGNPAVTRVYWRPVRSSYRPT